MSRSQSQDYARHFSAFTGFFTVSSAPSSTVTSSLSSRRKLTANNQSWCWQAGKTSRRHLFWNTNINFAHQLDHLPDLPPCNFVHLPKMKSKLKDYSLARLQSIYEKHKTKRLAGLLQTDLLQEKQLC